MIYNNIDSAYLLGNKEEFNNTANAAANNKDIPEGFIDVYEFITEKLGGLLSGYFLSEDSRLLEKAIETGELLISFYDNWYPYSKYNLSSKQGKYNKIPLKLLINLSELYILHRYTFDPRYLSLIENVSNNLQILLNYPVLPSHAVVKDNKIEFVGFITSDYSSAEVQRIL
jgi:Glycosyl hydrolase family 47.